jgi:uncharacterized protein (TIGR00269 family)
MQCSKCRNKAVLFQDYSGRYLCRHHFEDDVEAKAKHEIRRHHWMVPGDHIAVALSGDSGSIALLHFLKKLTSNRRDICISAITVDEGIAGYHCTESAMRIADLLDTECIRVSFKERFGRTMDEIARTKGIPLSCTYCRVLRNFLLNRIAMENGITKLAFGRTLDEEAVSVLKNVLLGNVEILVRSERYAKGKIPHIFPFIAVPGNEVAFYADLQAKGNIQSRCPYDNKPFEEDTQALLNDFTVRHPATKYALLGLKNNLTTACDFMADSIFSCERCGEPADGIICQSCHIIDEVNANGT